AGFLDRWEWLVLNGFGVIHLGRGGLRGIGLGLGRLSLVRLRNGIGSGQKQEISRLSLVGLIWGVLRADIRRLLAGLCLAVGLVLFGHVDLLSPSHRLRNHLKFAILTARGYLSNGNSLR